MEMEAQGTFPILFFFFSAHNLFLVNHLVNEFKKCSDVALQPNFQSCNSFHVYIV